MELKLGAPSQAFAVAGQLAALAGAFGAPGRLWGSMLHKSLPGARILPVIATRMSCAGLAMQVLGKPVTTAVRGTRHGGGNRRGLWADWVKPRRCPPSSAVQLVLRSI